MSKARCIEAEFRTPENMRYGVLTLSAADAYAMIQRAAREKVRVLGIDSVLIRDGSIQPQMEHSVDYSARSFFSDSDWDDAVAFIQKKAPLGFVFEVVLGDDVPLQKMPNQSPEPTRSARGSS